MEPSSSWPTRSSNQDTTISDSDLSILSWYVSTSLAYVLNSNLSRSFTQTTLEYLAFAAGSKLFAAIVTYPYQVVRARLQEQNSSYEGAMECVTQTVKHEGMKGLYKGITPYLIHVMPNICLVFIIYEKMSK